MGGSPVPVARMDEGSFGGRGGIRLFFRRWRSEPEGGGVPVVIAHGLAEHSGRYERLGSFLAGRGVPVWALDHRGHGRSDGPRVHVDRFDDYLEDLDRFLDRVQADAGQTPVLLGHSMGGLIALSYALARPQRLAGLVLSSPWLRTRVPISTFRRAVARVLSGVWPRFRFPIADQGEGISRDPEVVRQYREDPLVARSVTARWFVSCEQEQARVMERAGALEVPVLFLVAGSDTLVWPEAARAVYEAARGPKEWHLYEDRYHEVFNDPGYEEVMETLWRWLVARGLAQPPGV